MNLDEFIKLGGLRLWITRQLINSFKIYVTGLLALLFTTRLLSTWP